MSGTAFGRRSSDAPSDRSRQQRRCRGIPALSYPSYSWSRRPIAYSLDLYVEPSLRSAGIGTALIERLAELGRKAGWLKIYWMTEADNDKAHALYGKIATRSPLVRYDFPLNSY